MKRSTCTPKSTSYIIKQLARYGREEQDQKKRILLENKETTGRSCCGTEESKTGKLGKQEQTVLRIRNRRIFRLPASKG